MKLKLTSIIFSLSLLAVLISSCSTTKVATTTNDDVYFTDISANNAVYAVANTTNDYNNGNYTDQNGYARNNNYYEEVYNPRFNMFNISNNYSWRDYYYRNSIMGYDPFFGPNSYSGFNNGMSLSFNSGFPFNGYNNFGYNNFGFNNYGYNNFNNNAWNNFGSFYGNSPYWGIYSFYNQGYYGNYGGGYGYGGNNGYYVNSGIYGVQRNNPRPNGSYDNSRPANSSGTNISYPSTRPIRNSATGSGGNATTESSRNSNGNNPNTTRPTRSSAPNRDSGSSQPSQSTSPQSRPTRTERPSSPPPSQSNDSGRSSSGGGSSPAPRPTRTGGN